MPDPTALATWSAARGATAGDAAITPVARFGDVEAEYRALRDGAGLWDAGAWGVLRFSGQDRLAFLHKYCTQDVKGLAPGQGARACCLTVKGGMVADLRVLAREDDALVLVAPAAREALPQHLAKYALFDKVTIAPAADLTLVSLRGPRALEVARSALGDVPDGPEHAHAPVAWSGGAVTAVHARLGSVPGVDLLVAPEAAPTLADALVAAGAHPVGSDALDALRVEEGWPLFGVDMDERTIPIEAGLEAAAVSFTKGCYVGQEVIARVAHRGHVNRGLAAARLDGPPPGPAPLPLLRDGKEVAQATTLACSPRAGAWVAFGLLHKKHGEPGTTLQVGPDGPPATVVALPIATP